MNEPPHPSIVAVLNQILQTQKNLLERTDIIDKNLRHVYGVIGGDLSVLMTLPENLVQFEDTHVSSCAGMESPIVRSAHEEPVSFVGKIKQVDDEDHDRDAFTSNLPEGQIQTEDKHGDTFIEMRNLIAPSAHPGLTSFVKETIYDNYDQDKGTFEGTISLTEDTSVDSSMEMESFVVPEDGYSEDQAKESSSSGINGSTRSVKVTTYDDYDQDKGAFEGTISLTEDTSVDSSLEMESLVVPEDGYSEEQAKESSSSGINEVGVAVEALTDTNAGSTRTSIDHFKSPLFHPDSPVNVLKLINIIDKLFVCEATWHSQNASLRDTLLSCIYILCPDRLLEHTLMRGFFSSVSSTCSILIGTIQNVYGLDEARIVFDSEYRNLLTGDVDVDGLLLLRDAAGEISHIAASVIPKNKKYYEGLLCRLEFRIHFLQVLQSLMHAGGGVNVAIEHISSCRIALGSISRPSEPLVNAKDGRFSQDNTTASGLKPDGFGTFFCDNEVEVPPYGVRAFHWTDAVKHFQQLLCQLDMICNISLDPIARMNLGELVNYFGSFPTLPSKVYVAILLTTEVLLVPGCTIGAICRDAFICRTLQTLCKDGSVVRSQTGGILSSFRCVHDKIKTLMESEWGGSYPRNKKNIPRYLVLKHIRVWIKKFMYWLCIHHFTTGLHIKAHSPGEYIITCWCLHEMLVKFSEKYEELSSMAKSGFKESRTDNYEGETSKPDNRRMRKRGSRRDQNVSEDGEMEIVPYVRDKESAIELYEIFTPTAQATLWIFFYLRRKFKKFIFDDINRTEEQGFEDITGPLKGARFKQIEYSKFSLSAKMVCQPRQTLKMLQAARRKILDSPRIVNEYVHDAGEWGDEGIVMESVIEHNMCFVIKQLRTLNAENEILVKFVHSCFPTFLVNEPHLNSSSSIVQDSE